MLHQAFPALRQVRPTGDRSQSRQPRDRGSEDPSAGPHHSGGLAQRPYPLGAFDQVVERAEQQRDIQTAVRERQPTGIADQRLEGAVRPRLLDLFDDRIQQGDRMSGIGECRGMDPSRTADVSDPRSRMDPLGDEFLRTLDSSLPWADLLVSRAASCQSDPP